MVPHQRALMHPFIITWKSKGTIIKQGALLLLLSHTQSMCHTILNKTKFSCPLFIHCTRCTGRVFDFIDTHPFRIREPLLVLLSYGGETNPGIEEPLVPWEHQANKNRGGSFWEPSVLWYSCATCGWLCTKIIAPIDSNSGCCGYLVLIMVVHSHLMC